MKLQLLIEGKIQKINNFSCFKHSYIVFILLIIVKMPTNVGILTLMSRIVVGILVIMSMINFILNEHKTKIITPEPIL